MLWISIDDNALEAVEKPKVITKGNFFYTKQYNCNMQWYIDIKIFDIQH